MKTTLSNITRLAVVAALSLGLASSAFAAAPKWEAAITHLEAAKTEMNNAKSHGGKKDEALKKIDEAIELLKGEQGDIQANQDKKAAKKEKKQ